MPVSSGPRYAVGALALAACAALLAGCGQTVTGEPVAVEQPVRRVDAQLSALLPDPARFPAGYPAVVLPPEAAAQAAGDLNGVARGSSVRPQTCAPPEQRYGPDDTVIAVGTAERTRATLTVELTRTGDPLSALREQVRRCGELRVGRAGATATVTTTLDPSPPVDADDTLALRRTVAPDVGGAGLTQSMRTLAGQIGDVRITVTYMTFGDETPDTAALDELFTTAVGKVRAA